MTVRVVLVDDQEMIRMGFRMVLDARPDLEVVGEAANGADALEVIGRTGPDVVLMDIRMPVMDGVEATRRLCADPSGPKVLVLTTFDEDDHAYDALQAGASGFLLKETPVEEIAAAIGHVQAGDAVVSPSTTRRLLDQFARVRPRPPRETEALTPRENDVLALVARGLSNAEIAAELVLSEGTVKVHVGHILAKLGLRDRVQAVVHAYETGLVEPGTAP